MEMCRVCNTPVSGPRCDRCGQASALLSPPAINDPFTQAYGSPSSNPNYNVSGKKIAAGICGILLGALGVHKFILGYTKQGLIMLLVTLLTFGLAAIVVGIIGLIEGIVYLTKSDQEFFSTYVVNKRKWF